MNPVFAFNPRSLRLTALLAILAVCLQLVANGVSGFHAAQRLADSGGAMEICTPAGIIRITDAGTQMPEAGTAGQNCVFCGSAAVPPPLLITALSFFLPVATGGSTHPLIVLSVEPDGPDLRHAPSRAPPAFFA